MTASKELESLFNHARQQVGSWSAWQRSVDPQSGDRKFATTAEGAADNMELVCRLEFGSHLYGTNTPTSDRDFKGVYIPNRRDILLQRVKSSTGHKVVRPEGVKNSSEDCDDETYSLQEYLKLLAQGQTVALDMLFATKYFHKAPLWDAIFCHREKVITKKAASFLGYCRVQANKYGIKGSRVSAARAASEFFTRMIEKHGATCKVHEVSHDLPIGPHAMVTAKVTSAGNTETFYDCCNRLVGYKNTVKEAANIYSRIYEEYGKRARLAESNEGVDWKALSHAVRVGNEAIELLDTAFITFPLPNKEHILDIKLGKISYKIVAEEIEDLLVRVEEASLKSSLRDEPDNDWIDGIVENAYYWSVNK